MFSKKIKKWLSNPTDCFIILSFISLAILIACFYFSKGELLVSFFFYDARDTGMDFFHSIEFLKGNNPYIRFNTLYPPLANLFFRIVYLLIPSNVTSNWAEEYIWRMYLRNTEYDLRTYQSTMISFFIFLLLFSIFLSFIIDEGFKNESNIKRKMILISFAFSYGIITGVERGNIVILVFDLLFFTFCLKTVKTNLLRNFHLFFWFLPLV